MTCVRRQTVNINKGLFYFSIYYLSFLLSPYLESVAKLFDFPQELELFYQKYCTKFYLIINPIYIVLVKVLYIESFIHSDHIYTCDGKLHVQSQLPWGRKKEVQQTIFAKQLFPRPHNIHSHSYKTIWLVLPNDTKTDLDYVGFELPMWRLLDDLLHYLNYSHPMIDSNRQSEFA